MGSKISTFTKLPPRWIMHLLFGLGLMVCLVWLIMAHYQSQVKLQKGLLKDYHHEVELHAFAIDHFFQERREDIFDLSKSRTIRSFFANKALGMSMQYGLKASLVQIEELFTRIVSAKIISGKAIYNSIVMLDKDENIIASTQNIKKGQARISRVYNLAKFATIDHPTVMLGEWPSKNSIVLVMPIWFKREHAGYILAQVNKCLLLDKIVYPAKGKYQEGMFLLAKTSKQLISICDNNKISARNLKLINELPSSNTSEAPLFFNYFGDLIVQLSPIKETPLVLLAAADKHLIEGSPRAEHILYFLIAVISVLLGGLAILVRTEIRSSNLRMELAKNEAEKVKELEQINSQLDGEIAERLRAESKANKKNKLLSGLNHILFDALQESSIEDVASKCLEVISELTGCRAGLIGIFTEEGHLKTLGFSNVGDDECELDLYFALSGLTQTGELGMFSEIKNSGKLLIMNDPQAIADRVGLPEDHIKIRSLLVAPLILDSQTIGIISIANKKEGFNAGDADNVKELSASFITVLVQKQTDEALRLSEERNRTLVESITEGLLIVNEANCITYANDNMLAMLETDEDVVLGRSLYEFLDDTNKKIVKKNVEMRKKGSEKAYELAWDTPSGRKMHTMVYPKPYFGDNGQFMGALALVTDLSASKAREAQILQTQKLEAIGQLAAGIAHEINTPTNFVANNTMFLRDSFAGLTKALAGYAALQRAVEENQPIQPVLDDIQKLYEDTNLEYVLEEVPLAIDETLEGIDHIAKIVRSMKEFAHPGSDSKSLVNLNDSIRNTVTVAKNEWKYVAELEMDLDPDLPLALCVPSQVNQVILNLIVNAAQAIAMDNEGVEGIKGSINISTRAINNQIEIRIADSGPGVPEELQQRIFEPFFTTKEPGKGTGQGLAISHTVIVEKHGGSLKLESDGKKGTTFIISLPAILDEDEA